MPAAVGAAMLGSRNGRRQARAALGYAAEFGAYSVGFALVRGALAGFTVYFDGRHAGSPTQRTFMPMAAGSARVPTPDGGRPDIGQTQPSARDAASQRQQRQHGQQQQHNKSSTGAAVGDFACDVSADNAPAAARRRRGCRGGQRRRPKRGAGGHLSTAAHQSTCNHVLVGSSADCVPDALSSSDCGTCKGPPAPSAPPKGSSSSLSHSALVFTPSTHEPIFATAPSPPPSAAPLFLPAPPPSQAPPLPSDSDLVRHLLPHALLSYEELRWQHHVLSPRSSQKRRASSPPPDPPPSPAPPGPPPSSAPPFILSCVVHERPPPPPPRPSRERERARPSWDYRSGFMEGLARSRSRGGQGGVG